MCESKSNTAATLIQKHIRGYLSRKEARNSNNPPSFAKANFSSKNSQNVHVRSSAPKLSKSKIQIENFVKLISQETYDSPDKQATLLEVGSELASFRKNIEENSHSPNSFNQDPQILMGLLPISPITYTPFKNFTTVSSTLAKVPSNVKPINLVPYDDDDDIEQSMGLLSSNFNKMKLNMHTPTFPVKSEESNMSWEEIKTMHNEKKLEKVKTVVKMEIPDFNDISSIPGASKSFEDTYSKVLELNSITDIPAAQEINKEGLPGLKENSPKRSNNWGMSFQHEMNNKFNETIVLESSILLPEEQKGSIQRRPVGKRTKLLIPSQNPNLKPVKTLKAEKSYQELSSKIHPGPQRKKSIHAANMGKGHSNPPEKKLKKKSFTEPALFIANSPEIIQKKTISKLPGLRKSEPTIKHKSEPKINPYSSDWSQNTLKNHFKVKMQISNQATNARVVITKFVLKKKKMIKMSENLRVKHQ